jgi:hypothetical protein
MAIPLISKQAKQIQFHADNTPVTPLHPALNVTIETGVAVFTFLGTNPNDWTRDTLSFPVGVPGAAAEFTSGMASAGVASFWTPLKSEPHSPEVTYSAPVSVGGSTDDGHSVTASGSVEISIPSVALPPPLGCAVDSASVSYSAQAGQPVLEVALAVFGVCTAFLRVSYTAFIVNSHGAVVVTGGAATTAGA